VDRQDELEDRTPCGHDLSLLRELQELSPAERIARNCAMADWIEKLQAASLDQPKDREHLDQLLAIQKLIEKP
jgi:hypothetical protein